MVCKQHLLTSVDPTSVVCQILLDHFIIGSMLFVILNVSCDLVELYVEIVNNKTKKVLLSYSVNVPVSCKGNGDGNQLWAWLRQ